MNKIIQTLNGETWERISKAKARKHYNNGGVVIITPVWVNLSSPWHIYDYLDGELKHIVSDTFDQMCDSFAYYNCNSELGYYLAYYVRCSGMEEEEK